MMRPIFPAILLCVSTLGGCSNLGNLDLPRDYANIPTVRSIVDEITCELTEISRDKNELSYLTNDDFVVAVELNLDVTDDGALTPSFTYTNGLFSFAGGAKLDVSRDQNFSEQLFFSLRELKDYAENYTSKNSDPRPCASRIDTPLSGDLGLKPTAHMAIATNNLDVGQKIGSAKAGAFGGFVKFVIVKNINGVGPTWTLKHFKGPGGLLGLTETNTDQMFFAFAKRLPDAPPRKDPAAGEESASKNLSSAPSHALRPTVRTQPTEVGDFRAQQFLQELKLNQLSSVLTQIQVNTK